MATAKSKVKAKAKRTWQKQLDGFVQAVEIGIAVYRKYPLPPVDDDGLPNASAAAYARESRELAKMAKHAEPPFANLKSLAYLEYQFFLLWNETHGRHVTKFWNEIAKHRLPYEAKDIIADVLARGKVRTRIEYEHVVDAMGGGPKSRDRQLSTLIAHYESRKKR